LVHPWKGVHCDQANFSLILEYWSVGVLESRRQDKHPLRIKMEIRGILFVWGPRDLDHYSSTPTLPGYFKAEPSVSDLVQRARVSKLD